MEKKIRKMLVLGTVLALIAMTFAVVPMSVSAATFHVGPGQPYPTIQSAINAANPGDTIIVHPSTYNENVIINKQLTLHGYGTASTIINGGGTGDVVKITASGVIMFGFTVQNGGGGRWDGGIELDHVQNCQINDTYCTNNNNGIFLNGSDNNLIFDNICNSNRKSWGRGISLYDGSNNNAIMTNICNVNHAGIVLVDDCNYNRIIENECNSNNPCHGINLERSHYNLIANNTCMFNFDEGIYLCYNNDRNILYNNAVIGNFDHGIILWDDSDENIITNNTIIKNADDGIELWSYCDDNHVKNNLIEANGFVNLVYGIDITGNSNRNLIYHNNIINNFVQAWDTGANTWDFGYPLGGNYWSDWSGPDDFQGAGQNIRNVPYGYGDGIIDMGLPAGGINPYFIPGGANFDTYPLILPLINDRVQRPPIRIENNAMFLARNGVVSGSGTANDPYIIEDWHIDGSGWGWCTWIGNTTSHFEIRDCYVFNASGGIGDFYYPDAGITLYNVTNGTITKWDWNIGDPYAPAMGFIVPKLTYVVDNSAFGILLAYSYDNTIEYCIVMWNYFSGIALWISQYNFMLRNTCSFNGYEGIWLCYSSNNLIDYNICSYNMYGIYIEVSWDNEIIFSRISNNEIGICIIWNSYGNSIIQNNITDNIGYGIEILFGSNDNIIHHNNFFYNNGATGFYNPLNIQAYDECINQWDDGYSTGNFWCDWLIPPFAPPFPYDLDPPPYISKDWFPSWTPFPI